MAKVKLEKWEGERRYWKARLIEQLREGGNGERGGLGWLTAEEMRDVVNHVVRGCRGSCGEGPHPRGV